MKQKKTNAARRLDELKIAYRWNILWTRSIWTLCM